MSRNDSGTPVPVKLATHARLRRFLGMGPLCAAAVMGCADPTAVDALSDFLILTPGDYFFGAPLTIRPSATSTDSVLFRWSTAKGADRYTIIFAQAQSRDSLVRYDADLGQPTFTIAVSNPQSITIPYGTPNPQLDTIPVAEYPAWQHVVKMRELDALLASQPKGVPLYFVWTMEAHAASKSARSVEKHRLIFIRG